MVKLNRRSTEQVDLLNRGGRSDQSPEAGAPSETTTNQETDYEAQIKAELAEIRSIVKERSAEPGKPPDKTDKALIALLATNLKETVSDIEARRTAAEDAAKKEREDFERRIDEKLAKLEQQSQTPAVIHRRSEDVFDEFAGKILDDPEVKHYLAMGKEPRDCRVAVPSLMQLFKEHDTLFKRATLGATELGGTVVPVVYRPGIVEYMHGMYELAAAVRRVECTGDTYRATVEPEVSGYGVVKTTLAAAIDGDPTPKTTCTLTDSTGFEAGMWVRFYLAASTPRLRIVSVDHGTEVLTFATNAITFDAAGTEIVICEAIGTSAESVQKPEGYAKLGVVDATLQTIATYLVVALQRLWAKPDLADWLRNKLYTRFVRQLSWHLLYGTGTTYNSLDGLFAETGAQEYVWSDGELGDNRTDALMKAALLIPNGMPVFFMNSVDWMALQLEKDGNDNYIHSKFGRFDIVDGGPGARRINQYVIGIENNLIPGTALAIDLNAASEIAYNPNGSNFVVGTIDKQLIKNERTNLYEEHMAHAILTTQAYVEVTLDEAPSA